MVSSRGVEIPATFTRPAADAGAKVPLVVMAHGHGGTRDEAGGFARVAEELARNGIASIRVDFPGCGESTEPFTANTLTNMLADIRAARGFAVSHPQVDTGRVGILGYSMGGRLALLATSQDDYSTVVLWAPAAGNGSDSMLDFLGGQRSYEQLKAQAEEAGHAVLDTLWGATQHLSLEWFIDLENSDTQSAASEFEGALLVLYASDDRVVSPQFGKAVVESATRSGPLVEHVVDGGGHGLGFYTNYTEIADAVVATTTSFLSNNL
jgi:dienelactone hydrolase